MAQYCETKTTAQALLAETPRQWFPDRLGIWFGISVALGFGERLLAADRGERLEQPGSGQAKVKEEPRKDMAMEAKKDQVTRKQTNNVLRTTALPEAFGGEYVQLATGVCLGGSYPS